jgi:hypothetical protein
MQTGQTQFSVVERFAVVGILLLVFAMLIQKVLHSVKVSEERSLNHAAVEYTAVKGMYAEQKQIAAPSAASASETGAANVDKAPIR